MSKRVKNGCIDPDDIPCDKARAYLEKEGLLCGVPHKKAGRKKSIWDEWLE